MHRLSSIALVIACLLIAGGAAFIPAVAAPSQQTAAPPIGDIIAMEQVERQYPGAQYSGRAALDFGPFDAALAALDMAEANTHEARLLTASIDEMQAMMGGGELSAERLALLYLRRIQRLDPQLNAVLELNPDALDIARQLDAERAAGRVRGPLHGIPVLLKANIGTGDRMTTSAGSAALASSRADADAFIVSRLRQAGAVILGKVNLSEWANFMTSASANGFSTVGGHTRNPYGRFDVGGSSSGSAVAVAAGFAPLTVGTETAGSLVYPASQNAVVTLKPSVGLISRDRIIPITDRQDTAGPMARTVREAALLAGVLSGLDAADPITAQAEQISAIDYTAFLDVDALRGVRVAVVSREEVYREGDAAIVEAVIARLTAAGAEVVTVPPLEMRIDYLPILFYGFHAGVNHYLQTVAQNTPVRTIEELIAFNAADMDNRAPFGQDLIERALTYELTTEEQADYDQTAESNRETAGAMIREVLNTHNAAIMVDLSNYSTAIYAPAGFPAVTLPAGYRETGEPIGVTLIGDYLDDPRLLAYAYALEQVEPVRRPPPLD